MVGRSKVRVDGVTQLLSPIPQLDRPRLIEDVAESGAVARLFGKELFYVVAQRYEKLGLEWEVERPRFDGVAVERDRKGEPVAETQREISIVRPPESLLEPKTMLENEPLYDSEAVRPIDGCRLPEAGLEGVWQDLIRQSFKCT